MIFVRLSQYHKFFNQISRQLFIVQTKITMEQLLKPPEQVYLMTNLDKKAFQKCIKVPVINLGDITKTSPLLRIVKKYILKFEHFKAIYQHDQGNNYVYLNPEVIQRWTDLPQDVRSELAKFCLTETHFKMEDFTLQYEHFTVEAIFRAVLPRDKEGVSSFTKVGHIVHINLREHLIPYKSLIGDVLFDKVKGCKSVVNKVNMIDNTYRNFQMELLKGDNQMHTTVKENNCTFEFDFSTVYWNSRLCTEHERIIKCIKKDDVLFDVFAGVGPFSIPAAKKKCKVFANDLNPESYRWLTHNKKLNKISCEHLSPFCLDGRDFILTVIRENLPKYSVDQDVSIVMNLPALAVTFLDAYIGLFRHIALPEDFKSIKVYIYCFAKGEGPIDIARKLVCENLKINGVDINSKILDIFKVRTVSSMKEMMRVTLSLDRDILVGVACDKRKFEHESETKKESKKTCTNVNNGQEQKENQQCIQSSRGKELENESQS